MVTVLVLGSWLDLMTSNLFQPSQLFKTFFRFKENIDNIPCLEAQRRDLKHWIEVFGFFLVAENTTKTG